MSAVISDCGKYRYVLKRSLGSVLRWYKPMLFIMLNPSTADAMTDDPTIRKCMGFAKREGMTHITVVNLFALRSTFPKQLKLADDPVGPLNDQYLDEEIKRHAVVVAAWGAHQFALGRALKVYREHQPFMCLGTTKHGCPRHPLYVGYKSELQPFKMDLNL